MSDLGLEIKRKHMLSLMQLEHAWIQITAENRVVFLIVLVLDEGCTSDVIQDTSFVCS